MAYFCFTNHQHLPSLQTEESCKWKPGSDFYKGATQAGAFVIASVIALVVWPALAPPLLITGAIIGIARLVINITDLYNPTITEKIRHHIARFRNRHRLIQIAALIAVLAIAIVSWQVACLLAIPLGIYVAVVIGLDSKTRGQKAKAQNGATRPSCF